MSILTIFTVSSANVDDRERPYPPEPRYMPPHPPGMPMEDSPTVKGLFYMLIAGILILIGSFVCGIISIIGYILALVGFFKIYSDRHMYPEPHPSNMSTSLIFYLLGIIIVIIGIVFIVASAFILAASLVNNKDLSGAFDSFLLYIVIGTAIILIGGLFWVFGRYKLLSSLMPEDKISFLNIAMVIVIVSMVIGLITIPILFSSLEGTFEDIDKDEEELTDKDINKYTAEIQAKTIGFTLINGALSIISEILFIICFYFAYDHQKRNPQLRTGGTPFKPEPYYPPPPAR